MNETNDAAERSAACSGYARTVEITEKEIRAIITAIVYLRPDPSLPGIAEDKATLLSLVERITAPPSQPQELPPCDVCGKPATTRVRDTVLYTLGLSDEWLTKPDVLIRVRCEEHYEPPRTFKA